MHGRITNADLTFKAGQRLTTDLPNPDGKESRYRNKQFCFTPNKASATPFR